MPLLDGRVVIVTGAGRGIGREHALELAAHGARVVVNDLGVTLGGTDTAESPADEVVEAIRASGGEAIADRASVSDFRATREMFHRAVDKFGAVHAVVNNAGIARDRMITSMDEADWDNVIDVHLKGTFNLTKHACDWWRAEAKAGRSHQGRIVNTTSGAGLRGNLGQSSYSAAKAAIAALTMTSALEMVRYGVAINAISPLAVTRLSQAVMQSAPEANGFDRLHPKTSSPVVAYLVSTDAGWLTGQVLRIDGASIFRERPWTVQPDGYRAAGSRYLKADEVGQALRLVLGVVPWGLGTPAQPIVSSPVGESA